MKKPFKPVLACLLAGLGLCVPAATSALALSFGPLVFQGWIRPAPDAFAGAVLDDARLDDLRGGFEADSGLSVRFGIERMVIINGQMVATTSFNVINTAESIKPAALPAGVVIGGGGLRVFSGGQGGHIEVPLNLGVIQIGPNNVASIAPGALAGTLIQNSLDGQHIQNITTLNATVNSASMLKAQRLQDTLRETMIGALRR